MDQRLNDEETDNTHSTLSFEHLLSKEEMAMLLWGSKSYEYNRRDSFIRQDSHVTEVYFILKGLVKVSREMRKGKNLIIRISKPGEFVGLSSALASDKHEYSATALEPLTVQSFDLEVFKKLILINGQFANEIAKHIGSDNLFNIRRLSSLLSKQLPGRVADLLLYFSDDIYSSNQFTIPLTRQELAEVAGTTKESLIRTLSEFRHDKIVNINRNTISINSMSIIKTLSRLG